MTHGDDEKGEPIFPGTPTSIDYIAKQVYHSTLHEYFHALDYAAFLFLLLGGLEALFLESNYHSQTIIFSVQLNIMKCSQCMEQQWCF